MSSMQSNEDGTLTSAEVFELLNKSPKNPPKKISQKNPPKKSSQKNPHKKILTKKSSMQSNEDGTLTSAEVFELMNKSPKCYQCGEIFSQKLSLIHHKESAHEGKKPHKCKWCNASFFRESNLRPHIDKHFFSTDSSYFGRCLLSECKICDVLG